MSGHRSTENGRPIGNGKVKNGSTKRSDVIPEKKKEMRIVPSKCMGKVTVCYLSMEG